LAEKALGKYLPPKACVHHHGPTENQCLVICQDQAYHMLLEQRTRAYNACGHASWRKCWVCQQYDAPENLNISKLNAVYHRDCLNLYCRTHPAASPTLET
jgi:hypothetical protein